MSLYHHSSSQGYVHPHTQPSHSYHHVAPAIPSYAYAQSPYPVPFSDPSSFRREYTARLSELTINSRPIIQNLSMMAQSCIRYADIVAECLQAHIRRVPPWMKLPAFYVLDAISKNVFEPYAAKFSAFVVPLFLETYSQVDDSTRSKMEEMLVTWRTGALSGKELFGVAPQVTLERKIWGNDPSMTLDTVSRRQGHAPPLTKSQVLAELDVTLALKEQAIHVNPYDTMVRSQISVLQQLRRMVESGVSQEELQQILAQLRAMGRESASIVSLPPPPLAPSQQHPVVPSLIPYTSSTPNHFTIAQGTAASSGNNVISSISSSSTPTPSALPSVSGISNLFQSLVKAGLVSANATPTGAGLSTETPPPVVGTPDEARMRINKDLENERFQVQRDYARTILGMKMKLSTADITKHRPASVDLLYKRLPTQCKQCAMRFPDGLVGKKKMEDHLDMHFRQNRRAKEAAGRGYSRSWFISIQDWISDPLSGKRSKDKEPFLAKNVEGGESESEDKVQDSAVCDSYIVIPPGDEAKSVSCAVCKETFKSEFREDDEEWIWCNAVRVKDKLFHATCHAEMLASGVLAAKLRADGHNPSSRTDTPDDSTPCTPSKKDVNIRLHFPSPMSSERKSGNSTASEAIVTGIKRKADDKPSLAENTQGADESDGTPPLKKIALPAA